MNSYWIIRLIDGIIESPKQCGI